MNTTSLSCQQNNRRQVLRQANACLLKAGQPAWNGIDYVETELSLIRWIQDWLNQRGISLELNLIVVHFLCDLPDSHNFDVRDFSVKEKLTGSLLSVELAEVDHDFAVLVVPGLVSNRTYELSVTNRRWIDPLHSKVSFTRVKESIVNIDPKPRTAEARVYRESPNANYLARDYGTLRKLILDRLSLIMPDWQERHVPDLGITLVELLQPT